MRRLFAWLLTIGFLVPTTAACVPSGYEGDDPHRPPDTQVDVGELQDDGTDQPPAEEPSEEGSE